MTPDSVIVELLERVNGGRGIALIGWEDRARWPAEAFAALKRQHLLEQSQPASSTVCPGCEEACTMPVHTRTGPRGATLFIFCDKRGDISRVVVEPDALLQWHCSMKCLCRFVAGQLGLRQTTHHTADGELWEIGMASGKRREQMLGLRSGDVLSLTAGNRSQPLIELLAFRDGGFSLDVPVVTKLVDSSTTGDKRYTASIGRREARKRETEAMHDRWGQEYRRLKKKNPKLSIVRCSQLIAKMSIAADRDAETIRKNMKP